MKILLTGAKGFIGRNFLRQYSDTYDFECVDIAEDIRNTKFDPSIDAVVHLGAFAGVRRSHDIPEEFWEMNVIGTQQIFDQYMGKPIVWASSSSIYEWWLSPYATSKKVCEQIAPGYTLGLRFHTVYGADSRPDMLYDKLKRREVQYITNHTRDWTHVEDVCSAIHICLTNFNKMYKYRAIDVGNGRPVSVKEMADKVWPDNNLPLKEVTGERENTCADPTILLQYGWEPKHYILDET